MPDTVAVSLEVGHKAAAALSNPRTRALVSHLINRVLDPGADTQELASAFFETLLAVRTHRLVGAGFAANDSGHTTPGPSIDEARAAEGRALATKFRDHRRGQTLRGLRIQDLIEEGRR